MNVSTIRRRALLLLLAVSSMAVIAAEATSHESPEAAFEAFKQAQLNDDHAAYVACVTDESVDRFAGQLIRLVMLDKRYAENVKWARERLKKLEPVLKRHGLSLDAVPAMEADRDMELELRQARELIEPIENRRQFVAEMLRQLDQFFAEKLGQLDIEFEKPPADVQLADARLADARLADVKIDGRTATATAVSDGETLDTIHFKKTADGWRIHVVE